MRPLSLFPLLFSLLSACGSTCPKVDLLDSASSTPALVELLFSVTCDGAPVTTITAADLQLTENGGPVGASDSPWVVQRAADVLNSYTMVLLDVSSVVDDEASLTSLKTSTVDFVEAALNQGQEVAVAIFDGDVEVRTLVSFSTDLRALTDGIEGIAAADRRDPSTNLNGAVLLALASLDDALGAGSETELHGLANLVVITDGVDSAQREPDSAAQDAVNGSVHEVFFVGVVSEESAVALEPLAKTGLFRATGYDDLVSPFQKMTDALLAEVGKFYRMSYCSPLRSPSTTLSVQVNHGDGSTSISYDYDTAGFGPGCALPQD